MEPNGSLPYKQKTTTDPYSKTNKCSPRLSSYSCNIHCNIILIYVPLFQIVFFLGILMQFSSLAYVFHLYISILSF